VRRREFITLLSGAVAWPLAARAQQTGMRRVGIVMPYPKGDTEYEIRVRALRQELARLGWTEGGNVQFDERWTTDNMDLVRATAASLMSSTPDVVVASGGRVIPLLMQLSRTIPIVVQHVTGDARMRIIVSLIIERAIFERAVAEP
jgi:putative tryptophan/tyrosine transport system substrate-binding protein